MLVKCARCDCVTTAYQMDVSAAKDFYGSGYYHGGDYADYESSERFLKRNFDLFIDRMRRISRGDRLLEVGCAYGFFLDVAQQHWAVEGIDVSPDAVASCATRFEDRVRCGHLLTEPFAENSYDWIVAWDTIEHVNEPKAYATRCFQLLAPGGHVAFTTGDISSIVARCRGSRWRLLTPPSHLTFFSRNGMRQMLCGAGFEQIRFGTTGYRRPLDFILYRIVGARRHNWAIENVPRLHSYLQRIGLYLNLFDVMFVTARKPSPGRPR